MPAAIVWLGSFVFSGLAFKGVTSYFGDAADAITHPYQQPASGIDTKTLLIVGGMTIAGVIAYKKLVK